MVLLFPHMLFSSHIYCIPIFYLVSLIVMIVFFLFSFSFMTFFYFVAFKVLYVLLLIYFIILLVVCALAIYGTFKVSLTSSVTSLVGIDVFLLMQAERNKLPPFIAMMTCTEIAAFALSILIFVQLSKFEEYLLFDNDTYWNMAKMVG